VVVFPHTGTPSAEVSLFILNPRSSVPVYRQIEEQVRRLVASGLLAPGTPLPSVREVAVKHSVNYKTVSRAYVNLEAEGLLDRNPGQAMTIATGRHTTGTVEARLAQLESQVKELVVAAGQLELDEKDVLKFVSKKWRDRDA
jgi:GntR family transcriptional regulator